MEIRNEKYNVLSRSDEKPEMFPDTQEPFTLTVRRVNRSGRLGKINIATIYPNYAASMGDYYVHVRGKARIGNQRFFHSVAKYDIARVFPEGTIIGELILKRLI